MRSVADQHGLVCLLHEKPFAFMNGSGKHNNWSITADSVGNLLEPGNDPANNVSFLLYVVCIMAAVDTHQDLLRIAVASAGNDHRLGGNEAPPAIISIFLGEEINDILQTMVNKTTRKTLPQNNTHHGMKYVASFAKDHADRNRTSPFAFTGNKFEFRMPGSATDIAICNTVLNTALADILEGVCDRLAQAKNRVEAVKNIIKELFKKHQHILFDGDGYSVAWQKEAKRRHLLNLKTTPEALAHYPTEKNITLLTKHGIYTKREILARYNVMVNEYCKTIKIESLTMLDMFNRQILPSVLKYQNQLAKLISNKKSVNHSVELTILKKITALTVSAVKTKDTLINDLARVQTYRDILQKATNYHRLVLASMGELRDYCDQLERLMPKVLWPIPTYADILFSL